MKFALPSLAAVVGVAGVTAEGTNETITTAPRGGLEGFPLYCLIPRDGVYGWFYNSRSDGPYQPCKEVPGKIAGWGMLNAYRSGGTEGVHWKYTDNLNDGSCFKNWKYYSADGQTLIATISGRTTTQNDPRRWCALPVYRSGGVQGKQWEDCECSLFT